MEEWRGAALLQLGPAKPGAQVHLLGAAHSPPFLHPPGHRARGAGVGAGAGAGAGEGALRFVQ